MVMLLQVMLIGIIAVPWYNILHYYPGRLLVGEASDVAMRSSIRTRPYAFM